MHMCTCSCGFEKKVQFSMDIGNGELIHECFPKHFCMGTAKMKSETEREEGEKRGVSMERSKAGTKDKKVLTVLIKIQ